MRTAFRTAGWLILAASVVYLALTAKGLVDHWPDVQVSGAGIGAFVAGILLYVIAIVAWGWSWAYLVSGFGCAMTGDAGIRVVAVSQVTKYLPGNVAHHVGRVALARRYGVDVATAVASMVIELCWLAAASTTCVLVSVFLAKSDVLLDRLQIPVDRLWATLVVACAVPVVAQFVVGRWGVRFASSRSGRSSIRLPGIGPSLTTFFVHAANFMAQGVIVVLLLREVLGVEFSDYWLATGSFAVAWIAGFVAPGVPAGLGIREAVITAGLTFAVDPETALAAAILHRILTVIGDGLVFGLALALDRFVRTHFARTGI
jgi:uncharacterized membrane protein YbhN (UPF0104 family)